MIFDSLMTEVMQTSLQNSFFSISSDGYQSIMERRQFAVVLPL
jgi:hypothetical protein